MNDYPKSNVSARIYLPLDVLFCRVKVFVEFDKLTPGNEEYGPPSMLSDLLNS